MSTEISIHINTSDDTLSRWVIEQAGTLPNVKATQGNWAADMEDTSPGPDIMIIAGEGEAGQIFSTLQLLRDNFPATSIILISAVQDPKHIVAVMKSGVSEYLIPPLSAESFKNAIEEIRAKAPAAPSKAQGHLYSFISSKGGLGATVVAVNTAAALAENDKRRIALVDMSLQSGDSSTLLDILPQKTISDLCSNFHRLDSSFLQGAMTRHASGINFLPAPHDPEETMNINAAQIETILGLIRKHYDTTIVDCTSMSINSCSVEVFNASEKVFVLTDLSVPAIRNCSRLIDLIRKRGVTAEKVEIAVTRFIKGKNLTISEIEETLKKRIYWLFPNDFDCAISSINMGVPLVRHQPKTCLAKNIQEFVQKLQHPADSTDYRGVKGLFGKTV
ncbi:AAA family ATPase [Trichloromonas sp.]|uniref:AAA family ATPase n=1 Tax=Trichloromonas sp. TaxID=3069249 RepID=UPI003D81354C